MAHGYSSVADRCFEKLQVLGLDRESDRSSADGSGPWSGMLQQVRLPDNMDPESFLGYSRG